ncbi:MAG: hypothetical protein HGA66_11220, partial [Holophaga sp.]|nr:hypothetical protein [Holophaga sp.]
DNIGQALAGLLAPEHLATDPAGGESAVFTLRVLPRDGVAHKVQVGLNTLAQPQVFGPVVDVPTLTGFAGRLPDAVPGRSYLHDLGRIQVVADPDPAMKALHGKCLAISGGGLWRMDGPWSSTRIPLRGQLASGKPILEVDKISDFSFVDMCVRPAGSRIGDRRRMVGVFHRLAGMGEETYICGMDPDGTVWPIAGSSQPLFKGSRLPLEGPGPSLFFSHLSRTALDASGNILVVEPQQIRRIDPEGRVTLLAGGGDRVLVVEDGVGSHARFGWISDFTLDAASGDLYVSDENAIRRVRPDGAVTTVLGALGVVPSVPVPPVPTRIAEGVPCLELPHGLACQGGVLYICQPQNNQILAFNLWDRTLHTLLKADLKEPLRLGCLPAFAREKALADCANLPSPRQIVVAGRRVLVAADAGIMGGPVIVQFDLPHGVYGETERERKD